MKNFVFGVFALCVALGASIADAATLLSRDSGPTDSGYGSPSSTVFTSTFDSVFGAGNIQTTARLDNSAAVLAADALLINFNRSSTLSAAELANITAFANTGKKIAFIGENFAFRSWNDPFLNIFGGFTATSVTGTYAPIVSNTLTNNISAIQMVGAGVSSGSSVSLFGQNIANLWGPSQNVLTNLDSALANDNASRRPGQRQYATNVATWLTEPSPPIIPLPAALPLLLVALGALGFTASRRKAA